MDPQNLKARNRGEIPSFDLNTTMPKPSTCGLLCSLAVGGLFLFAVGMAVFYLVDMLLNIVRIIGR